ncbi:restriction endonuclease subunit S (plasmid) [Kovacikia minuta CCNUW1]|uniref:restriction endonuclease subunit S n=1 Tax=Kovacikia minuta TaxID=2931930 RepID=UPI001CC9F157|nr:restriction endonuclease subunit S [Kovacikia minuta]UBF30514.1 restriction endonuclease subunit S [Kovacikia minuta CCNUW1]
MSDELMELPEGWEWITFEGLVINHDGKRVPVSSTDRQERQGDFPYYGASGIIDYVDDYLFDGDFLLIAEDGANLISRSTPIAFEATGKFWVNNHAHVVEPLKEIILTSYLRDYFNCTDLKFYISGSAQPKLNQKNLNRIPIPLPPLNEQKRIVAAIESLRERSQKARSALAAIPELCDKFRQSVLAAAFRGDLTADWREQNPDVEPASVLLERIRVQHTELPDFLDLPELPESWSWSNLGAMGKVSGGLTKNSKRDELPLEFPYLRVANVYANSLDLNEVKTIKIHEGEYKRVLLQKGDLLVVEGNGSIDQIGRVALWEGSIDPCLHQNHLIKVRFNPTEIGQYILLWLLSNQGRKYITRVASSTAGLHTLSLSKVSALPVPTASQPEQQEIVERVKTLLKVVNRFEQQFSKTESQVNLLDRSILAKAFRGELVEQDPSDEPASVLLERIRAEREQQAQGKAKKPGKKGQRTIKADPP